jgi:tetratricopeptide (TPR) repeat protein
MQGRLIVATVAVLWSSICWCDCLEIAQLESRLGAEAYRAGKNEDAIRLFETAAAHDPNCINAHLWLGTALANKYLPGDDEPANTALAERASGEFQRVLDLEPDRVDALKAIGFLSFYTKKFNDSKAHFQRVIAIDTNNAEAYYTIGVIDWTEAYQPRMELRARLGLKPEDALISMNECIALRASALAGVEEGIKMLSRTLEIRPEYDDAMAYLNLLYRERADIQCGDPAARDADLTTADHWVGLTLKTKKRKAEQERARQSPGHSSP